MNIAFVNPEYPSRSGRDHGGIATYIYNMANALAAPGHRVFVVVRRGTEPDVLDQRIELRTFHSEPLHPLLPFLDRFVDERIRWERGCSRALRRTLLDIHRECPLHIVEVPEYNGLAHELPSSLPFALVIHFHTPTALVDELNSGPRSDRPRKRWHAYERRALRNAHAYKCTSASLRDRLPALCGVRSDRVAVIRNPMPTAVFDAIEKRHDLSGERIDLLFSGRLERRKGSAIMHGVIQDILDLDERVHVTFAGETDVGETVSTQTAIERAVAPRQRHRVWFLGALARGELYALYCRSSLFLMPSLFDNAPNALFEAMAAGLPVVAADVGGINEIIRHDENGLLFDPHSPPELLACLRTLIQNPTSAARLASCAYHDIRTLYAPSVIARQTLAFYQQLLEPEPSTRP